MKTCRIFEPRSLLRRALAAALIVLLSCSNAGCGRRVSYVNDSRALIKLKAGEPAPRDGVLLSEGYLSEIFEAMKR